MIGNSITATDIYQQGKRGETGRMSTLDNIWRQQLEELFRERGGPKKLAEFMAPNTPAGERQWTPNFLTQLRDPRKAFGRELAAEMERRAMKPAGWMSGLSHAARPSDATLDHALQYLHALAEVLPSDIRFRRFTWPMVLVAAKEVEKGAGDMAQILAAIKAAIEKGFAHA